MTIEQTPQLENMLPEELDKRMIHEHLVRISKRLDAIVNDIRSVNDHFAQLSLETDNDQTAFGGV